ncbi:MAG: inosine/xanthosine triphosphatase [bacterium]
MKKVIVASENPVKLKVAEKAFFAVFPNEQFEFIGIKAESGVPDQPIEEETRIGANNRLSFIKEKYPIADFWIAQEGGVFLDKGRLSNRAWIVVSDRDNFIAESSTSNYFLPKKLEEYIKDGLEQGAANDKFFNTINSKQGLGAVGCLTDGIYDRTEYYLQPAVIALSQIKHKDWY